MKHLFFLFGILFLLQSCKTGNVAVVNSNSNDACYTVRKIKKQKNDVYFIYAERNDTTFKIYSVFDPDDLKEGGYTKLKRGSRFNAILLSQLAGTENKFNMVTDFGVSVEVNGITVSREPEHNILDVYACDELNGRYIKKQ
jgi:hypothetical protein